MTYRNVQGEGKRDNVIMLILESGSAVDSSKTSGLHNLMPQFDKIQSEGITYTNFIANSFATDTALISLLKGIATIPFTNNADNYNKFKTTEIPLPQIFKEQGFKTYFITTGPLSFLNKESFLKEAGYEYILGSESFENKKKYTFWSAPDAELYATTIGHLGDLRAREEPYFMTLLTISQHLPYYTPYGFGKNNMYRYTDDTLYTLYESLKEMGFFDNGMLIIIGDHRKMTPLESNEYEKYGISSYGRIVCTVIGKDIPKHLIDHGIYQQTDIYYSLKRMFSDNIITTPKYNDIFTGAKQRPFSINANIHSNKNLLAVITDNNACTVKLNGDNTRLLNCPIQQSLQREALDYINTTRANQIHINQQMN